MNYLLMNNIFTSNLVPQLHHQILAPQTSTLQTSTPQTLVSLITKLPFR